MGIKLEIRVGWTYGPNAKEAEEDNDRPVINLHPSLVFGKDEIGSKNAFPSLSFGKEMVEAAIQARTRAGLSADLGGLSCDHPRRARVTEEWDQLRVAWSLHRNGKDALVKKRLAGFVPTAGYTDPPDTLADWVFQFAASLAQPAYAEHFEEPFQQLMLAKDKPDFARFIQSYGTKLSASHARSYFESFKSYLALFPELSQVHHLVTAGIAVGNDHAAGSTHFDATRMLYGNLFEAFGENVEFLVCLNNLIEGRQFDQLRNIELSVYQRSDKAGRCRAVAGNAGMTALCAEFDNQIRNASYHGGMEFDRGAGVVTYRSGKGGLGNARTVSYASYLAQCSTLFCQLLVLLRLEILVANEFRTKLPL